MFQILHQKAEGQAQLLIQGNTLLHARNSWNQLDKNPSNKMQTSGPVIFSPRKIMNEITTKESLETSNVNKVEPPKNVETKAKQKS